MGDNYIEILRNLVDREKLRDLCCSYARLLDDGAYDPVSMSQVFIDDANLVFSNGAEAQGVKDISELNQKMNGLFSVTNHIVSNVLISFEGSQRASVRFNTSVIHKMIPPFLQTAWRQIHGMESHGNVYPIKVWKAIRKSTV